MLNSGESFRWVTHVAINKAYTAKTGYSLNHILVKTDLKHLEFRSGIQTVMFFLNLINQKC